MNSADRRMLSDEERVDWLRLSRTPHVGPVTFFALIARYDTARAAIEALPELSRRAGRIKSASVPPAGEIRREMERAERIGLTHIAACEPGYPGPLAAIEDAPPVILAGRNLSLFARPSVAIVGARNASLNGRRIAAKLARDLSEAGLVVVSGLARGIDARAHQAAIETGTIAVLAGGLGNIYPAEHEALLERLLEQGAAISEMLFGWEARGRDFPRRNRIVAGLCRAVVVVEAARRSGSLITAKFAAEEGREVFAVPGSPLDPRAEGANDLLRDGATLCTRAEDVIDALVEQNLARTQPDTGFFEPGSIGRGYEPLWDELDLPEVGAAPFGPTPANPEDGASPDARPRGRGGARGEAARAAPGRRGRH